MASMNLPRGVLFSQNRRHLCQAISPKRSSLCTPTMQVAVPDVVVRHSRWHLEQQLQVCGERPFSAVHLQRQSLVTVSSNSANLWRRSDGLLMGSMPPQGPDILLSDSDGRRLATAGDDGRLRLWDLAAGRSRFEWSLGGHIHGLALFGPTVAVACDDDTVFVDAYSGRWQCCWKNEAPSFVAPLVDTFGTAFWYRNEVRLCSHDLAPSSRNVSVKHPQAVTAMALSAHQLATADANGTTYLWARADGRLLHQLNDPSAGQVSGLSFRGRRLVVGRKDHSEIICCRQGRRLGVLPQGGRALGHLWALLDQDKRLQMWHPAHHRRRPSTRHDIGERWQHAPIASLSTYGHGLAVATADGRAEVWQLSCQRLGCTPQLPVALSMG